MAFHVPLQTPWTPFGQMILCVYLTFKAISECTHSFWAKTHVHRKMCIKLKVFGVFPHRVLNNLTLGLPYALRTLRLNPPLPIWSAIYWASWIHWGGEFGEKGNYKSLFPHLFMLEFASLCPFGAHSASLPKLSIVMEDWSGGGPGGGLGFSGSKKCWQRLSLMYLYFINRNIDFLSNTCA